jgi:hypothetical protein
MTDRIREKTAANPALAAIFEDGLDDSFHFKTLTTPTLNNHAAMRIQWRSFTEFYEASGIDRHPLPSEIELGVKLVPEGLLLLFCLSTFG